MDWHLATTIGLTVLLLLVLWGWARSSRQAVRRLREAASAKQSQSTRYGQISEQFAPFMAHWPWDPKGFRFLGTPIDGIQFTDEEVILVEIKSAGSRLSPVQRHVRSLVAAGRVRFEEVRIG